MDDRKRIAAAIRDYLARERISREQFAFKTKLGKSTVDKLLIGLFSDRTLAIVESHTKLPLRSHAASARDRARRRRPAAGGRSKPLDRPSIAVLPFTNMGGDPEQEFLADGITEDIITALARLRWLFVIARNSTFVYKGKAVDVRQVARELGVRYVLEGQRPDRRAGASASPASSSTPRPASTSGPRSTTASCRTSSPSRTTSPSGSSPRSSRISTPRRASAPPSKPPDSIDAWGLVVRALGLINKVDREQNEEAQALLRRAIAMEPSYARAHALLGWAVWWAAHVPTGMPDMRDGYGRRRRTPQDALSLDPSDPWARMVSGLCLSTAAQHDRALGELRTALHLNPSFALGHTAFGWALCAPAVSTRRSRRPGGRCA